MKILLLALACLLLTSCGQISRTIAKWTGKDEVCVDGVKYLQFTSGVSVKYNQNGSIAICEK